MTTGNNPNVEVIHRRVRTSYDELNRLLDGPLATMDTTKVYRSPGSGEWTIMENIAHIVEFLPYWADEIAKLVAHPGQNFGRTQQHEGRLRAIQEHGADSMNQARAALPASYKHMETVLSSLKDSDLELTGLHSKFGEHKLSWFIEDFVTKHFEDHIEQIKSCL
ncbi:MAG TPA: DinB family protein [Ktedonosporobacter sp.]|nr:DinB family protein [Ktedonosporobacter sp.]